MLFSNKLLNRRTFLATGGVIVAETCFGQSPRLVEIKIVPDKRFGTILIRRGEQVVLRIMARTQLEAHLHVYDKEVRAAPGEWGEVRFKADKVGRFPVERHENGRHRLLGYIEVRYAE